MSKSVPFALISMLALCLSFTTLATCFAQSGTKSPPSTGGTMIQGSGTVASQSQVAMSGYCPVCIIEMKKWVQGNPKFSVSQDGKTYLFPGEEQRQMFLANPGKYIPAYGGDCTVCKVEMNKVVPGSVQHATLHQGRLFLFPGDEQKQMFLKNPAKYADIDLAADGKCTVCRIEMQQEVQGKPEFSVVHKGLRYWFPGPDQQNMFVANPGKYEVK